MLFGEIPISSRELFELLDLKVGLEAKRLGLEGVKEYRAWTTAVKTVLSCVGTTKGYDVQCSGLEGAHEWLLDVVWRTDSETSMGVSLGCESEWNEDSQEVILDFQKLLCIKAPLKLMIYSGGPDEWKTDYS